MRGAILQTYALGILVVLGTAVITAKGIGILRARFCSG